MKITKLYPGLITPARIITERHKAEDIIKMGWQKVDELTYKGITFWEIVKRGKTLIASK